MRPCKLTGVAGEGRGVPGVRLIQALSENRRSLWESNRERENGGRL